MSEIDVDVISPLPEFSHRGLLVDNSKKSLKTS